MNDRYNYRGYEIVHVKKELRTDQGSVTKVTHCEIRKNGALLTTPVFRRKEEAERWIELQRGEDTFTE